MPSRRSATPTRHSRQDGDGGAATQGVRTLLVPLAWCEAEASAVLAVGEALRGDDEDRANTNRDG
jgi:hypothetical protein